MQQVQVQKSNKPNKKILSITLLLCLLALAVAFVGSSYNWLVSVSGILSQGNSGSIKMASQLLPLWNRPMIFLVDEDFRGVPGQTLPVTTANCIMPQNLNRDYIFSVTYRIPAESLPYIENAGLDGDTVEELSLYCTEDTDEDGAVLYTYFGRGTDGQLMNLGPLYVTFSASAEVQMNAELTVDAGVRLCQADLEAFQDVFGFLEEELEPFRYLFDQ